MAISINDNGTLRLLAELTEGKGPHELAVGVVGDLGLAFAAGDVDVVRQLSRALSATASALSEQGSTPVDQLTGAGGDKFVAGALWALADASEAYLTAIERRVEESASRPKRAQLRELIVESLSAHEGPLRPRDFLARASKADASVRPDDISKALGDLLKRQVIVASGAGPNDRRGISYSLVRSGVDHVDAAEVAASTLIVQQRPSGGWEVVGASTIGEASLYPSVHDAVDAARELVGSDGGGTVVVADKLIPVSSV